MALIEQALQAAREPLVCDQVECHVFLDQSKLIAGAGKHGMAVVAYSPLARGDVRNDPVLARVARAHGKSAAQICLRYLVQHNIVAIPRTSKLERLSENAAIFDFTLSDAELREVGALASRDGWLIDWAYSGRIKWD